MSATLQDIRDLQVQILELLEHQKQMMKQQIELSGLLLQHMRRELREELEKP